MNQSQREPNRNLKNLPSPQGPFEPYNTPMLRGYKTGQCVQNGSICPMCHDPVKGNDTGNIIATAARIAAAQQFLVAFIVNVV